MEKLDKIKARYTELVYQSVMSADVITNEINEAVRLLVEQDNTDLQERCAQLEQERKGLSIKEAYWRDTAIHNKLQLGLIEKYYTWEKPLTLWDHIKALLSMNKKIHRAWIGEDTTEIKTKI